MHSCPFYLLLLVVATSFVPLASGFRAAHDRYHLNRRHHDDNRRSSLLQHQAVKEATIGMGCFWKPSEELLKVDGVVDTVVGYTGHPDYAKEVPPTYDIVCYSRDWVEAVRVLYDDDKISYRQLLDTCFETHEALIGSRQYSSIIFCHDNEQEEIAKSWIEENQNRVREKDGFQATFTEIETLSPFYKAEEYHQNYWAKMRPKIVGAVALLAVSTGIFDDLTPLDLQSMVHNAANIIVLLGMAYVLVERKVDTKTVQM